MFERRHTSLGLAFGSFTMRLSSRSSSGPKDRSRTRKLPVCVRMVLRWSATSSIHVRVGSVTPNTFTAWYFEQNGATAMRGFFTG